MDMQDLAIKGLELNENPLNNRWNLRKSFKEIKHLIEKRKGLLVRAEIKQQSCLRRGLNYKKQAVNDILSGICVSSRPLFGEMQWFHFILIKIGNSTSPLKNVKKTLTFWKKIKIKKKEFRSLFPI